MLQEFEFTSRYTEYFASHVIRGVPKEFIKRLGDLQGSKLIDNVMEFIRLTENIIEKSEEYVYIIVDQFPLNYLRVFRTAIEKGVKFRILESKNPVFTTEIDELGSDELYPLEKTRLISNVDYRIVSHPNLYLFLSDKECIFSFPTHNEEIDYKGFYTTEKVSTKWCRDLFEHYFSNAKPRLNIEQIKIALDENKSKGSSITIEGYDDPSVDGINIQTAVDNYDEVILKGSFNIGTSTIDISRSLILRGDGRKEGIPTTKLRRQGWMFPNTKYERLMTIHGDDIEVTIENIHLTDWNNAGIYAIRAKSIKVLNNRLTLSHVIGRGIRLGNLGDQVIGITIAAEDEGSFAGEVLIKGNYLDFGEYYLLGGFRPRVGLEHNPDYRPNLLSHENCTSYGIIVKQIIGQVIIEDNEVRNINAFSIWAIDLKETSVAYIRNNKVISGVYGTYPVGRPYSGYGIVAHSHWEASIPNEGFHIEITGNYIDLDKVNYCGIAVHGPLESVKGAKKLSNGVIENNIVKLGDGSVAILVYRCDGFKVSNNNISGKAYYGIQITGTSRGRYYENNSNRNLIDRNDFSELEIKQNDEYSNNNIDFQRFTGTNEVAMLANVWLNKFSSKNQLFLYPSKSYLDEGIKNNVKIIRKNR
jgi:predicted transcriptional regulator